MKGLFRRAKAYNSIAEYEKATDDLTRVLSIEKSNTEARQELARAREGLAEARKKEKNFYGSIFNKLSASPPSTNTNNNNQNQYGGLYSDKVGEPEPKTKKCNLCGEEVDTIQWARHIIKKHSTK